MTAAHKLCLGGIVITMATTSLAYLGASSSWQFYMTVDELMDRSTSADGYRVRLNGKVKHDSLRISPDHASASFILQGLESQLHVKCSGPIPDNLTEGIEVVVEGKMESSNLFRGNKVLTRCASKYDSSGPVMAVP